MENENLATALWDLVEAIEAICLGTVTTNVIEGAGKALIDSWNDHNDDKIRTEDEIYNWEHRNSNRRHDIIRDSIAQGKCPCGEDH